MEERPGPLAGEVAALAADRTSGASVLLGRAVDLLGRAATGSGAALPGIARAVSRAQPSMGGFWNAASVALAPAPGGGAAGLGRMRQAIDRAPRAVARLAVGLLTGRRPAGASLHLVSWSASASVVACCEALRAVGPVAVSCGEGRPALEGRQLAAALASCGVAVRLSTDGGVGDALDTADAVLVGADAVLPDHWINKVGTGLLVALANARGVPVYVAASREKFVAPLLAPLVTIRDEPSGEVWADPPPGVTAVNRYFERIPIDALTAIVTDTAVIGAPDAAEGCRSQGRLVTPAIVDALR